MVISMVLATYMNTKMQIEATYFFVGQRFIPNLFNHIRDPNTKFHILPSKCFAFVGLIGINTKALKSGHWIKEISYPPLLGNVEKKSLSLLISFLLGPQTLTFALINVQCKKLSL